jgi:hypothetical protein
MVRTTCVMKHAVMMMMMGQLLELLLLERMVDGEPTSCLYFLLRLRCGLWYGGWGWRSHKIELLLGLLRNEGLLHHRHLVADQHVRSHIRPNGCRALRDLLRLRLRLLSRLRLGLACLWLGLLLARRDHKLKQLLWHSSLRGNNHVD